MEDKKDLLPISTLEECEEIFDKYIEPFVDNYAGLKDKLTLLRIFLDLLNRLESTSNHQLAGRILIFLAKVLNLYDQSGLNLKSEFSFKELPEVVQDNIKRICAQSAEKDKQIAQFINADMEEGETLSDDDDDEVSSSNDDTDRIYERFWKLQRYLSQPNLLYEKNTWFTFRTFIDTLLMTFKSRSATLQVWNLRNSYMTTPKALMLQLGDIYTRRCFLVQILIVLQYLELPVDSRPENLSLDKVQSSWLSETTKKIYALIDTMPNQNEGRKFLGFVRHVLKREELWNKWKNGKCKEPKRPELDAEDDDDMINMRGTYYKRRKISDELRNAKPYNMHVIGSQEMSRLWNMKPNQRFNTPNLSKYLDKPIEKQAELFKDPNYSFRVLRLLRKSPHFFIPTSAVIQSLDGYLRETTKNFGSQVATNANNSAT